MIAAGLAAELANQLIAFQYRDSAQTAVKGEVREEIEVLESHELRVGVALVNVQSFLESPRDVVGQLDCGRHPVDTFCRWRNLLNDNPSQSACLIEVHKRAVTVVKIVAHYPERGVFVEGFDSFQILRPCSCVNVQCAVHVVFEVHYLISCGQNDTIALFFLKTSVQILDLLLFFHTEPEERHDVNSGCTFSYSRYFTL